MNPSARISLCMIVKNEEANLERCLRSAQDIVRQIVVVDTGSTDRTKEIAASFGAELHEFAWCNDFSAARNFSLRFATAPWVMYLDADEEIAPESAIRFQETIHLAESKHAQTISFVLQNKNANGRTTSSAVTLRLWRRAARVYFVDAIHEILLFKKPVVRNGLIIYHYGYTAVSQETLAKKRQRNFAILLAESARKPNDTRVGWELAREHCIEQQYDRALEVITRTIACHKQQCPGQPLQMLMYEYLSRSQFHLGMLEQALATIQEARIHYPDHFTFLLRAGQIHGQRKEWELERENLLLYLEKVALYKAGKILCNETLIEGFHSEPEAKMSMAVVCFRLARTAECCRWLLEAYQGGCEEPVLNVLADMSGKLGKEQVLPLLDEMLRCRKSPALKNLLVAVCRQLTVDDIEYLRRFTAELKTWPD